MKSTKVLAVATLMAGGLLANPVNATTLLSFTDAPVEDVDYTLQFRATATSTSLSVGGYQLPNDEYVSDNVVSTGGGPNLLGGEWDFTPAALGSFSFAYSDGTAVPALNISAVHAGDYDVFTQTFTTTIGDVY